jgi:chromosome segregation ATPase
LTLICASLLVAGLAGGCTEADGATTGSPGPNQSAAKQLDRAKTETKEATQAVGDYAYAQKSEFVDKMKEQLGAIEKELDALGAKFAEAGDAASSDAKTKLDDSRAKWAAAKKQLDEAERATEANWDEVTRTFKASWAELQDNVGKTRQWLSDKIEP